MKKQGFLFGSIILVVSVILTKAIGALFKIPLANLLGGTGMGYFSSAYGLFMPIYAISVTGIPTAIAKLIAENSAFERFSNIRKIKRISLAVFALIGLAASLLVYFLALPFASYIVGTPESYPAIAMIAPSIFFGCVMAVYRGYYEGLRNMYPTAISQVVEASVKLISGLAACYITINYAADSPLEFLKIVNFFGFDCNTTEHLTSNVVLSVAAAAAIAGVTLSSLIGMLFLMLRQKIIGDGISKAQLLSDKITDRSKNIITSLMAIAVPVAIGSIVTNLTSLIDLGTIVKCLDQSFVNDPNNLIIPHMENTSNFIYGSFTGLAITVFNLIPSLTNMFGKGIIPTMSEANVANDKKRIKKSAENVLMVTAIIAIPSGIGISLLSKPILQFLFSSRIDEISVSYNALAILGLAVIFLSITTPAFAMLQAIGKPKLPVKIMIIGVIMKLIGNLCLIPIPEININGAAISTVLSYGIICISALYFLCKEAKIKIAASIFLKPLYSGILCGLSSNLVYGWLEMLLGNKLSLIISIAIGGLIYLLSLYLLGVKAENHIKSPF